MHHVIPQSSAINGINAKALANLETIDSRLRDAGILSHFCEIKGPVMDHRNAAAFSNDSRARSSTRTRNSLPEVTLQQSVTSTAHCAAQAANLATGTLPITARKENTHGR
jgi:hypothetical protein